MNWSCDSTFMNWNYDYIWQAQNWWSIFITSTDLRIATLRWLFLLHLTSSFTLNRLKLKWISWHNAVDDARKIAILVSSNLHLAADRALMLKVFINKYTLGIILCSCWLSKELTFLPAYRRLLCIHHGHLSSLFESIIVTFILVRRILAINAASRGQFFLNHQAYCISLLFKLVSFWHFWVNEHTDIILFVFIFFKHWLFLTNVCDSDTFLF